MPLLEDLLLRFRRVWAPPGPVAGQPGVPADLAASLDDELRELSAELAGIAQQAETIARAAEAEARAIVDAARSESVRIVQAARIDAPRVRADRAAARIRDRHSEIDQLIVAAEREADEIRSRSASRIGPVVQAVVADVFAAQPAEEQHASVVGGG